MIAAVFEGQGKLVLKDRPKPFLKRPNAGWVTRTAVCRSTAQPQPRDTRRPSVSFPMVP